MSMSVEIKIRQLENEVNSLKEDFFSAKNDITMCVLIDAIYEREDHVTDLREKFYNDSTGI